MIYPEVQRWPLIFKMLYLLMAFDGLATYGGLKFGLITEGNPVMALAFAASPLLTLLLKLLLSLVFLQVIYYAVYEKKLHWPGRAIPAFLVIHFVVALMHLHWIGLSLTA